MTDTPNPGSDAARTLGCTCPVLDNNHGHTPPWPGSYWITEGCPIHDRRTPDWFGEWDGADVD